MAQRACELVLAKRHEKNLVSIGAVEIDNVGYRFIVGMHVAFFVSLILEKSIFRTTLSEWWIILFMIFCAAQILRYWAMVTLGTYWNTKVLITPRRPLLKTGPYKILRHPNYVAVITELAVIPLIFSCYITSIGFTILNAFIIRRRIRIETQALTTR
ncbi:MAG TPA: isoprenylcysteine carboxylmethyltransferase family protein [Candidatus Acidoferrales bacterium]|nr:isoprenylcysteine carboxylmethyltransferase family protein [Candidatus Acidoferrales bacterium]